MLQLFFKPFEGLVGSSVPFGSEYRLFWLFLMCFAFVIYFLRKFVHE